VVPADQEGQAVICAERSDTIPAVPTEAQRRKVRELVAQDWTSGAIAEHLDVPLHIVTRIRSEEGIPAAVGRPATGKRERVYARVDDDVAAQIDANAARDEQVRADVVAAVLTAWARSENPPTKARK
jgi:hypothetical protein